METTNLKPGDKHYKAYVGPPEHYDFMGATQFRLLCTLGLRSSHSLLDFGCGSLRSGRFFLNYLDQGKYFGIEPNRWLVEEAIQQQVGHDLVAIKKPHFDHNDEFSTNVFNQKFDFIVAQSIFSHTDRHTIKRALYNFRDSLNTSGLILATFVEGNKDYEGSEWVYPGIVKYRRSTIERFARESDLLISRLPWYHPRQSWFVLTNKKEKLPTHIMMRHLSGAVLFDNDFSESWNVCQRAMKNIKQKASRGLPVWLKTWLRSCIIKSR